MIMNRKREASIISKIVHIISIISKGINHDSIVFVVEFSRDMFSLINEIKFMFQK